MRIRRLIDEFEIRSSVFVHVIPSYPRIATSTLNWRQPSFPDLSFRPCGYFCKGNFVFDYLTTINSYLHKTVIINLTRWLWYLQRVQHYRVHVTLDYCHRDTWVSCSTVFLIFTADSYQNMGCTNFSFIAPFGIFLYRGISIPTCSCQEDQQYPRLLLFLMKTAGVKLVFKVTL